MLTHPVAVGAILALVINDHVLKHQFPGALTGKLSDFAGLVFFPLLLAETVGVAVPSTLAHRRAVISTAIAATGLSFAFIKLTAAGATTFAWSLGAAQWLVTLGFARGSAGLDAVEVVTDPTDLIALPALALAWAIATDQMPRWRPPPSSGIRFAIFLGAAFSSLATSRALPESVTEVRVPLVLDADRPVAVRHLSWDIGDVTASDPSIALQVVAQEAESTVDPDISFDAVSITVLPDEGTTLPANDGMEPVPSNDLTDACRSGCSGGVTVIVRLDPATERADVELAGRIVILGAEGAPVNIREDPDRRVDVAPISVVTRLERTVKVTLADPDQRMEFVLVVDGRALEGPLAFPLVGSAVARVLVTDGAMVAEAHEAALELPDDSVWFTADRPPADHDWLAYCQPRRDCRILITLHSRYDPTLDGTLLSPDPGSAGFVELHWTLEVRLEAFDGRSIPADAIKLEPFGATK